MRTNQQIQMLTFEEDQRKRDIEAAQNCFIKIKYVPVYCWAACSFDSCCHPLP